MYYIQKNGAPVATSDPNEVTKENFLVEPGAENKVWCKLEKYEFDRETGAKRALINQVRADNPGDFDRFVREWKHQNMTITMLHDPREGKPTGSVPTKLAKLKAKLADENENKNENSEGTPTAEDWQKTVEAKEMAEKRAAALESELAEMKAKADAEARAAFEAQKGARAEEESPAESAEIAENKPARKSSK